MSWSLTNAARGGGFQATSAAIVSVETTEPDASAAAPDTLDGLRQIAHETYSAGGLHEALDIQMNLLQAAKAAGAPTAEDFLLAGLMLHSARRVGDGIALLQEGLSWFPDVPALLENLAVFFIDAGDMAHVIRYCDRALAAGSTSPNVHDCLADAYSRIGRLDLAIEAGRRALEAKDLKFGASTPAVSVPRGMPLPFNAHNPAENVIAYCLWGNDARYRVPLLESVKIQPHLFPCWTIRLYHDTSVEQDYLRELANRGVQLRPMSLPPGQPVHRKLLWRFDVIADPTVQRFLIRDADSLLTVKERVAVDAWLASHYHFHTMRDWYTHTDLLLAGMWGGVGNILPSAASLMQHYSGWRVENDHVDQDVLSETVWPIVRNHILIHDSIFTGTLGSVPFPPFGTLPEGFHIGQNAFLHFKPSR